ncbi:hypothetical protein DRO27_00085 [Candidatus Bathyarchaeota archaeon]|nr:MAG: hypothetical protein DRO27_00085 [Candidatus Bathyarchaeota archaeon]
MSRREVRYFCLGVAIALCFILGSMYTSSCQKLPDNPVAPDILGFSSVDGRVNWSWDAPTTGTPVAIYIMQVNWERADDYVVFGITREYHSITAIGGDKVKVRVAGIDTAGIQGPYSLWSEIYAPPGVDIERSIE